MTGWEQGKRWPFSKTPKGDQNRRGLRIDGAEKYIKRVSDGSIQMTSSNNEFDSTESSHTGLEDIPDLVDIVGHCCY